MNIMNKQKELEIGGISFGLTSGVITTLGMIVSLTSATGSKVAIMAAILTVAISDALADALGMHLSEESRLDEKEKPVWKITEFTFLGRFLFSIIFLIPFMFLSIINARNISVLIGLLLILALAIYIEKRRHEKPFMPVVKHLLITIIILAISHFIGKGIGALV